MSRIGSLLTASVIATLTRPWSSPTWIMSPGKWTCRSCHSHLTVCLNSSTATSTRHMIQTRSMFLWVLSTLTLTTLSCPQVPWEAEVLCFEPPQTDMFLGGLTVLWFLVATGFLLVGSAGLQHTCCLCALPRGSWLRGAWSLCSTPSHKCWWALYLPTWRSWYLSLLIMSCIYRAVYTLRSLF